MGILDKPELPRDHIRVNLTPETDPVKRNLMENGPTQRWRSIFQGIKDEAITAGLPGQWRVIGRWNEPNTAAATGTRVRKNAFRYMVPGTWDVRARKFFNNEVFDECVLEVRYMALPQHEPNEINVLPGRRGPAPQN